MTRVIQWGMGNVGRHSLRGILERSDLELVGLRVYNPEKVGQDAGVMMGGEPIGITASGSSEEMLALDADVVLYNAFGTVLVDLQIAVDEICALLASGKNVISSAIDLMVYVRPGIAPAFVKPEMIEQIQEACRKGGTSVYSTGMTPGFALDLWPVSLGRVCRKVDTVYVKEMVSLRNYPAPINQEFMGFGVMPGKPIEMFKMFEESADNPKSGAINTPYASSVYFIGDAFGVDIDRISYEHQNFLTAKERLTLPSGTFEEGSIVGIQFRLSGWSKGHEFLQIDFDWRVDDTEWSENFCAWETEIKGDPTLKSRIEFETFTDARRSCSITVASHCLNAIPQVVAAKPGMLDAFSIPIFTGRAAMSL